jgi:dimethylargininase
MTRPFLEARRPEVDTVSRVLARYRTLLYVDGSGTLEGGDVVRVGNTIYAGLSTRTNKEGARQLAELLQPFGYEVRPVAVTGSLHLKTACTYLGDGAILANPKWVDTSVFEGMCVVEVPQSEEWAANTLRIRDMIVLPASFPRTRELLESRGFRVAPSDVSELQKAEAGVSCCSIVFESGE